MINSVYICFYKITTVLPYVQGGQGLAIFLSDFSFIWRICDVSWFQHMACVISYIKILKCNFVFLYTKFRSSFQLSNEKCVPRGIFFMDIDAKFFIIYMYVYIYYICNEFSASIVCCRKDAEKQVFFCNVMRICIRVMGYIWYFHRDMLSRVKWSQSG